MLSPAILIASSSEDSRTSQVAKLRLQLYLAGIPADFSKVSFLRPLSLLVFRSMTTNDIVFGCTSFTSWGMGKILLPWKDWEYFSLFFMWSCGGIFLFFCAVLEAGIDGAFCAGWIELAVLDKDGHLSSGFNVGLRLLNMTVWNDVDGVGSSIVAWRNWGGISVNIFYEANEQMSEWSEKRMFDLFSFFEKNESDNK